MNPEGRVWSRDDMQKINKNKKGKHIDKSKYASIYNEQ